VALGRRTEHHSKALLDGHSQGLDFAIQPLYYRLPLLQVVAPRSRVVAVAEGQETEEEQRGFLADGLNPFFVGVEERDVVFSIWLEAFDR
jgi:hypothetical protein